VTLDTPKGLSNLTHPGTKPGTGAIASSAFAPGAASAVTPHPSNLDMRKIIYHSTAKGSKPVSASDAAKIAEASGVNGAPPKPLSYACETCGTDCTRTRYHSLKDGEYTVCPSCFVSGRFPSNMFSGDFVRLDEEAFKHSSAGAGAEWSDQETLLLLEGVEMHDDDWEKVAVHVGTRSKQQCIAKFLQLPIEDQYLAPETGEGLGPLRFQAGMNGLPFSASENPVMSVVTFLASAVGPSVAAAAAQSALGELSLGLKRKRGNEDGTDQAVKKEKATGEASPAAAEAGGMDVDEAAGDKPKETQGETDKEKVADADETDGDVAPSKTTVERAASLALGAAAAKASVLAQHEDRRISALVSRLVAAQVRKVELKMGMFEKLEGLLESEHQKLELSRQSLFKDKKEMMSRLQQVDRMIQGLTEKEQAIAKEKAELEKIRVAQQQAQQSQQAGNPSSASPATAANQAQPTPTSVPSQPIQVPTGPSPEVTSARQQLAEYSKAMGGAVSDQVQAVPQGEGEKVEGLSAETSELQKL
jgi:SWI/SNF related-matrix-associated actin-dependent regulator of chromatin subfamily C